MNRTLLLLLALLLHAAALRAQVFTPAFQTPKQAGGVGALVSGGVGSENGFAIEGVARQSYGPIDLGLRVGVAGLDNDPALLVGLEYRNPLPPIPDLPLDVDLSVTGAAQAIVGPDGGPGVSAGVTGGHDFALSAGTVTPYVHPRVALIDRGSFAVAPLLEVGADFAFASGLRFHLALAAGTETANLGFGLSWR